MLGWQSDLFEDGADSDGCGFEGSDVAKLIINCSVTFRIPPRKLRSPVHAAGFTWKNQFHEEGQRICKLSLGIAPLKKSTQAHTSF